MRTSLLAVFASLVCGAAVGQSQTVRPLEVYWIDVEGGAATLIVTPAGESVLMRAIPAGAIPDGSSAPRKRWRIWITSMRCS
jgi:hypothetical protein